MCEGPEEHLEGLPLECVARGHGETVWDLTENTSVMGHTTSVVKVFVLVIVIYFQVFCFSNLILSLLSDCELLTVLNLM